MRIKSEYVSGNIFIGPRMHCNVCDGEHDEGKIYYWEDEEIEKDPRWNNDVLSDTFDAALDEYYDNSPSGKGE